MKLAAVQKTVTIPVNYLPCLYSEMGNEIRHYNTIRTSLSTFLLTVSVTAFCTYLRPDEHHEFMVVVGYLFSAAAVISSWFFSYRSAKAIYRYKQIRSAILNPEHCDYDAQWKDHGEAARRMVRNFMNWVMLIGVIILITAFQITSQPVRL
jgi:hypothetical protein